MDDLESMINFGFPDKHYYRGKLRWIPIMGQDGKYNIKVPLVFSVHPYPSKRVKKLF